MLTLAMASLTSVAQTPSVAPAKATSGPSASATTIPSDATFNEFLKKMFGWNPDLTWKVVEIKPSEASGISEATVVFSTPQGQQLQRIYVTADQKYAFSGEIIPFGADPFAVTREQLKEHQRAITRAEGRSPDHRRVWRPGMSCMQKSAT